MKMITCDVRFFSGHRNNGEDSVTEIIIDMDRHMLEEFINGNDKKFISGYKNGRLVVIGSEFIYKIEEVF